MMYSEGNPFSKEYELIQLKKEQLKRLEAELKAKDARIEAQSSVIIACQNAILQKDERIIELEIIVQKMKSCENCSSFREMYFDNNYCNLTTDEEKECQKNNYSNWQLKDKK